MEYKVIFHVDELNKWNLALKNTGNLLDAINTNNFNIEILANAEAVKAYVSNNNTEINLRNTMKALNDRPANNSQVNFKKNILLKKVIANKPF